MGTAAQKPANKRRGRPIAHPHEDDEALKSRRERNREAQHIFRQRRQAAEAAQERRLHRLEDVVEEMSSVFMRFADDMLGVDLVKQNPGLVKSLRCSMVKILALAREVVEPESEMTEMAPADRSHEQRSGSSSSAEMCMSTEPTTSYEQPFSAAPENTLPPSLSSDTTGSSPEEAPPSHFHPGSEQPTNFNEPVFGLSVYARTHSPQTPEELPLSIPPQIYGNGWGSIDPMLTIKAYDQQHGFIPTPLAVDSFPLRLAEAAIETGYRLLNSFRDGGPLPPAVQTMFGSTLSIRTRQIVLYKLRWLLGPGKHDMYRVAEIPFAPVPQEGWPLGPDGKPEIDSMTTAGGWHFSDHRTAEHFFSAVGVYRQLQELGAVMLDAETMEISIRSPSLKSPAEGHTFGQPMSSALPNRPQGQPESWSFVNFFPKGAPAIPTTTLTMRLSVATLIGNLAQAAVCLARGPGFPKFEIGRVIESAIIMVHGGDGAGF